MISLTGVEPTGGGRVTVRVPAVLASFTDGRRELEGAGATLGDAIAGLAVFYAELVAVLRTDQGELSPFVNVYLNGRDARTLGGLDAPLREGDEVMFLAAVVGG